MTTDITPYSYRSSPAIVNKGRDYILDSGCGLPPVRLKRDVDFGVIPKTKKPSLYKAGAEKVALAYGLCQRYHIESKVERADDDPLFYYLIRCDLVKIIGGAEYTIVSAYGSANSKEKRNGFNGAYDSANSAVKMAQKRALVGAALALCSGSDMFTQDIEDEKFMESAAELLKPEDPERPISTQQIRRIYAIAASEGLSTEQAKTHLAAMGITSTKQIKQKDYDAVCSSFREVTA